LAFEVLAFPPSETAKQALNGLPEGDEDVGEGLEAAEQGEHDPVHHPLHLDKNL